MLYLPVPHFREGGTVYLEDQACSGLSLWAEHFDRVLAFGPVATGAMPTSYMQVDQTSATGRRVEIHSVPMAYRPDQFLRAYPSTRRYIRSLIGRADYLSFAIGGLFGDWGAVACREAYRMKRAYAVWTDRVESEVTRQGIGQGSVKSSLKARLYHRPMAAVEHYAIRRAALGLFHGRETYNAYARFCSNPHVVHDIHLTRLDHISAAELEAKITRLQAGPVKVLYVGRADAMKGPMDWIAVVSDLIRSGVEIEASWLGDGTQLEEMRAAVAKAGLEGRISLPGFLRDRTAVRDAYRDANILLFCHKTPESPRCLIEALAAGTPIVGYDGAFAADLIAPHGGGRLVPMNDRAGLTNAVRALVDDRAVLVAMTRNALKDADPLDEDTVFRHRSEIIKAQLPGPARQVGEAFAQGNIGSSGS